MRLLAVAVVVAMVAGGCSGDDKTGDLQDLQVIGIDYELNSMIITNIGAYDVRTEGLWVYQDGESAEFDIFTVEPRATIRFSLRDVGGADVSGGEVALFSDDSFSDADAIFDYVAWGTNGHDKTLLASEAGLWGPEEFVDVDDDVVVILRADQASIGANTWIISEP